MSGFKNPADLTACAFGSECDSKPGGQPEGPEICGWCKNLSPFVLSSKVAKYPKTSTLVGLVDAYKRELEQEYRRHIQERTGLFPCVTKDIGYLRPAAEDPRDFNPQSYGPCGLVLHRGSLCQRCIQRAVQIPYPRRNELFDGDMLGFPCVFRDMRYTSDNPPITPGWQFLKEKDGTPVDDWFPKGSCKRAGRKGRLCSNCYGRLCERSRFGQYFNKETGDLRADWSIKTVGKEIGKKTPGFNMSAGF
ncbi:hypothetical protein BU26DRAFT_29149 [Trematosphaeria pertusa]|uniref:Uncharacterized protein n=1 Tax=Trematosphaeria pertusa TaxID=390896 RepID=A0A6A6J315_9PLEO|nr:uncharacterized protein BU26DRAFT_29149 [Trematosphaeria pertusa]KAF2256781.1 hypothetical protein BU26DRAFT_29149 [Trematosphaeria pertusa]